jgi:hypothetical protein
VDGSAAQLTEEQKTAVQSLYADAARRAGVADEEAELAAIPMNEDEVLKRDVDALPEAPDMDGMHTCRVGHGVLL